MLTPYPALLFVDPLTVPGAKVRLEGQKLGLFLLLEEAKPGRRAFSFRARSCALRAQIARCGSWAVPRSRGSEWARAWGRRMDGSRGWDSPGWCPRGASPSCDAPEGSLPRRAPARGPHRALPPPSQARRTPSLTEPRYFSSDTSLPRMLTALKS